MATRVLYLCERYESVSATAMINALRAMNCVVTVTSRFVIGPSGMRLSDFDLVCTDGPHHAQNCATGMLSLASLLSTCPKAQRPFFVWLVYENLPNLLLPLCLLKLLSRLRVAIDSVASSLLAPDRQGVPGPITGIFCMGHRWRVFGEILALERQGVIDFLGTNSEFRNQVLRKLGIIANLIPHGYDPVFGYDQHSKRDIDVLFLGDPSKSRRRKRFLDHLRRNLAQDGITLTIEDGSKGYLWGEKRQALLNRTKILLNILVCPTDMPGERLMLGMANGAMVLSEPIVKPAPFQPGKQLVTADIPEFARLIRLYLRDDTERQRIVDHAYEFVTHHVTMMEQCHKLLNSYQEHKVQGPA